MKLHLNLGGIFFAVYMYVPVKEQYTVGFWTLSKKSTELQNSLIGNLRQNPRRTRTSGTRRVMLW